MTAIFKREFKAYFYNVIGWLFMAVTLFFISLYFFAYNMYYGYPYISYAYQSVLFLFFISVPVLTMRILAEERKNKTDQMIYTAPVSVGKVVIGKYLAMLAVFTIPVAISCLYPLIMMKYGTISVGEAYTVILAYYLYGAACIAIGTFISSITESQIIAAVLSVLVLFLGYMMSGICNLISSSGNTLTEILMVFSLTEPFYNMTEGLLDLTSVLYYLTVIFLFLFFTVHSIQKRRWSFNKHNAWMGVFSSGAIVISVVIAVIVNVAFGKLPDNIVKFDVTVEKFYSISDDTKSILSNLEDDVTIYVLASENSQDDAIKQTLSRYAAYDHISVEYKDPTKYPNFANSYTSTSLNSNSLIVVCGDQSKVIDYYDLYETEYSFDYSTYNYTTNTTGYDAEGQLTSAISYVTSDDLPVVYVLQGHGEASLDDDFSSALSKENIDVETLNLLTSDEVPEDAACLLILGPETDINENEKDMILDYLDHGGNAYILASYTEEPLENFEAVLQAYGINIEDGMVVDNNRSYYTQYPYMLLPTIKSTDLTSTMTGDYVLVPYAVGFSLSEDTDDSLTLTTLLETSDQAVSKTNLNTMTTYEYEDGDIEGPFVLGVWAEKTNEDDEESNTELVAISSYMMTNSQADQIVSGNNVLLFQNIMSKLVDHETTVSIPVKSYEMSYLTIPMSNTMFFGIMLVIVVPLVMIIVGIVIWVKRRKQ
jgi:ABC-2 type transport system permease protein